MSEITRDDFDNELSGLTGTVASVIVVVRYVEQLEKALERIYYILGGKEAVEDMVAKRIRETREGPFGSV